MKRQMFFLFSIGTFFFWEAKMTLAVPILIESLLASIQKKKIFQSDIDRYFKTLPLRMELDPVFSRSRLGKKGDIASQEEVLEFLKEMAIILDHFPVSDSETEEIVKDLEKNNRISRDILIQKLKPRGIEFSDYFEMLRFFKARSLLIQRDLPHPAYTEAELREEFEKEHANNSSHTPSFLFHIKAFIFHEKKEASEFLAHLRKQESEKNFPGAFEVTDLGWLKKEDLEPALAQGLEWMIQKGNPWSSPIVRPGGTWILKQQGKKSSLEDLFQKNKDMLRVSLLEKEIERQVQLWLHQKKLQWSLPPTSETRKDPL